ncbi:MAG: TrmH family RNA methyltransferase [Nitriliruptoraceae bacterium]
MSEVYEPCSPEEAVAHLRRARQDPGLVRLEGAHALKHALRFGTEVAVVVTPDRPALLALVASLAPDVLGPIDALAVEVPPASWAELAPRGLPSPALAVAPRPAVSPEEVLAAAGRVVALDRPRHLGNLGATVRVAAAAHAGGVLVLDGPDLWHPAVVRAAAGLTFALPCANAPVLPPTDRPVVALDPAGTPLGRARLADDAVLLVGTERGGLDATLLARADQRLAIPMRAGVSSLNLATAVAVALYHDLDGVPSPSERRSRR